MNVTAEMVGFFFLVVSALAGAWWRMEAVVKAAKEEALAVANMASTRANILQDGLASLRLHVAEAYVSKQGLREQMEPLFDAVKDVGGQVRHMSERLDRVFEVPRAGRSKTSP